MAVIGAERKWTNVGICSG